MLPGVEDSGLPVHISRMGGDAAGAPRRRVRVRHLLMANGLLPALALVVCLAVSMRYNRASVLATHCRVPNWAPSISSVIGNHFPQRLFWAAAIAIGTGPRLLAALILHAMYHGALRGPAPRGAASAADATFSVMPAVLLVRTTSHLLEVLALLVLSIITSSDIYDVHEMAFITFLCASLVNMCCTVALIWTCALKPHTSLTTASAKIKTLLLALFLLFMASAYHYFVRHNTFCEPGVYSKFALCEYSVVVVNILFHVSSALDVGGASLDLSLASSMPESKNL